MVRAPRITPEQQAEERSLRFALVADGLILSVLVVVGVVGELWVGNWLDWAVG